MENRARTGLANS